MALAWGVFVNPQPFHRFLDDFSCYPEGSAGEPQWEVTHIGFEVRQGALWAEVPAGIGYALLRVAPFARTVTVEATVTVHRVLGRDWKIVGIGIFADRRNYWHLALVEAPEHMGRRHFAELAEMLDGVWNAHGEPATHLTTEEDTGGFDWQRGRPYRLRLTLTKERIIGEIFELDGTLRYRCIRRFDNRAVTFGRPMLDCGGFVAAFDDVQVEVKEVMPLPPKELKTFPPFPSRLRAEGVPRQKAMGFFRTDQINGVWWLVDPNGYPTLSIGTDHVNYFVHWCEKLGYAPLSPQCRPQVWERGGMGERGGAAVAFVELQCAGGKQLRQGTLSRLGTHGVSCLWGRLCVHRRHRAESALDRLSRCL